MKIPRYFLYYIEKKKKMKRICRNVTFLRGMTGSDKTTKMLDISCLKEVNTNKVLVLSTFSKESASYLYTFLREHVLNSTHLCLYVASSDSAGKTLIVQSKVN